MPSRSKRRIYSLSEKRQAITRQARSSLGVAEFCRRTGYSPSAFYAWHQQLGARSDSTVDFKEVVVTRAAGPDSDSMTIESSGRRVLMEVELPCGARFRVFDPECISPVVRLLAGARGGVQ